MDFTFFLSGGITELSPELHDVSCENSQAEAGAGIRKLLKQGAVHAPQFQLVSCFFVRSMWLQYFPGIYTRSKH